MACGVHAGKNRGIMAVALVQGGRDPSADRLETAWAAAFQRCGDVEFLADRQLGASSGCDAPEGPADEGPESPGAEGAGPRSQASSSMAAGRGPAGFGNRPQVL